MKPFVDQTMAAQTAYAQVLEAALGAAFHRSVADLTGSFASKTIRGNQYWYYQYKEPSGKLRQLYVGPDREPVRALVARKSAPGVAANLPLLAKSALVLGATGMIPRQFRVINRLAEYGFFKAGGVLIGTHAFLAYSNMLGVRWSSGDKTQDIDFAHAGKSLSVALPTDAQVNTSDAIESLGMGFLPTVEMSGKTGGAFLIPNEPEFRLDFLTPLHRHGDMPYRHPGLQIDLQPLPFMEFSLEGVEQTVLICPEGAVLVNVPDPARYVLHKLLIYGERSGTFAIKSHKDLWQAHALLCFLGEHRMASVEMAAVDLIKRGKGWRARFTQGVLALSKIYPDNPACAMLLKLGDGAKTPPI